MEQQITDEEKKHIRHKHKLMHDDLVKALMMLYKSESAKQKGVVLNVEHLLFRQTMQNYNEVFAKYGGISYETFSILFDRAVNVAKTQLNM